MFSLGYRGETGVARVQVKGSQGIFQKYEEWMQGMGKVIDKPFSARVV